MACFVTPLPSSGGGKMPTIENGGLELISTTNVLASTQADSKNLVISWRNHTDWWGLYGYALQPNTQMPQNDGGIGIVPFIGVDWDYLVNQVNLNYNWRMYGIGVNNNSGVILYVHYDKSNTRITFGNDNATTLIFRIYAIKNKF